VLNKCGGDEKVIRACYVLLREALTAAMPRLMARVEVRESTSALSEPWSLKRALREP